MTNINRDYFVILDVKSGELSGSTQMYFYNTDKNTSNIYVQLVVKETPVAATPIENATNYIVEAKIVKPGPVTKDLTATLVNESEAIYEFDLPDDCTNLSGSYKIEFWVKAKVADRDELITSSKAKYKVKKSILTDLDEAIEDSTDYPLLLQLMEEVRVINNTAHELDAQIRTLQSDMIAANETMKDNEASRQFNEALRQMNETNRNTQENARQEYFNTFDAKWEEYKTNTTNDIADYKESINTDISDFKSTTNQDIANYKSQINAQEVIRETNEEQRKANEQQRITNENDRIYKEDRRESQERDRVSNEYDRENAEQSREYAENTRAANEEVRQTNEANRETAEEIRKANEQARIAEHETFRTEQQAMKTELNEVKSENAILMENDKKIADRMTQVEISDKRQYVIMEGLMNSAGDGYLKIEDTGNDTTLYNSVEGFVDVKNITGNTMVNSIKNPDDELTLNADINTSGQSVTLTTAVDNGQVDVLAEGNTMVNVCDQQEAVAITKSYTVESGNHVALQGEYDGKCRPVVYGNTLVNLVEFSNKDSSTTPPYVKLNQVQTLKTNTTYTIITPSFDSSKMLMFIGYDGSNSLVAYQTNNIVSFTTGDTIPYNTIYVYYNKRSDSEGTPSVDFVNNIDGTGYILLEGDYTNKPIPDYFTGIQSSFEDKVVTQEMVDNGEELAENLGKYRVDYKVTGKNKISSNFIEGWLDTNTGNVTNATGKIGTSDLIRVKPNTTYTITKSDGGRIVISKYDYGKNLIGYNGTGLSFTTDSNTYYIRIFIDDTTVLTGHQLEEGSTATPYEPYKESIKTYYLNSPLLDGDTIEESNGNVYHVHRYGKVVLDGSDDEKINLSRFNSQEEDGYIGFELLNMGTKLIERLNVISDRFPTREVINNYANGEGIQTSSSLDVIWIKINKSKLSSPDVAGFKSWLSNNPLSVVYELASPQYELISQSDTILTDSYVAGHLDFDSAVPVEKVEFMNVFLNTRYIYPSTSYAIQFESDNHGIINLSLGGTGTIINNQLVNKGINKFTITTGDTLTSAGLYTEGIGFSASNIVVTEATDKDFGYFAGMKSVGELEENKISILSQTKNLIDESKHIYNVSIGSAMNNQRWGYSKEGNRRSIKIPCKPNTTYTFSKSGGDRLIVCSHDEDFDSDTKVPLKYCYYNSQLNSHIETYTFTTHNDSKVICIYISNNELATNIQLEEGSTATDYVHHAENSKQIILNEPLRAVGDTKDRFTQIDGKWYVERNCGETLLDGNVYVSIHDNSSETYLRCRIGLPANAKNSGSPGLFIKANYLTNCINVLDKNPPGGGLPSTESGLYSVGSLFNSIPTCYISIEKSKLTTPDVEGFKDWLNKNKIKVIYELASPTYEPVEISPVLNTYTDVTHITNNSTIPMNMPIVNSGYEVIAKPSTKYTVVGIDSGRIGDSTIVNGTITTPATIKDNFLRPYGSGKTSKVMLLEGEPANIPGYFRGIKSVFEDKVTEDGKYAVEVKVVGKNKLDKSTFINRDIGTQNIIGLDIRKPLGYNSGNRILTIVRVNPNTSYTLTIFGEQKMGTFIGYANSSYIGIKNVAFFDIFNNGSCTFTTTADTYYVLINSIVNVDIQLEEGTIASEYEPYQETKQTLYLDEPLYNTNNITIYNDKLGYWKNWDSIVFDGSSDENWSNSNLDTLKTMRFSLSTDIGCIKVKDSTLCDIFTSNQSIWDSNIEYEGLSNYSNGMIFVRVFKTKLSTQDVQGFKQYLSQNPVTVVYQLAEPVFVPLIDNCPNWIIGSWDNCSIHFDSIIPLKDTRYRYTGNVPSVVAMSDDVAEAKSISDEQDAMIVDLATDVAVMEMMLM